MRYCATRCFIFFVLLSVVLTPVFTNTRVAKAATNTTINFQARILQSSGALVPDGDYNLEFKIYDTVNLGATGQGVCSLSSSTDDCWWLETRTGANVVRVVNGYVSVNLGSITAFGANVPWDQDLYITMRVGGIGGPVWDSEMVNVTTGRMKMNAGTYAKVAGQLKNTNGANSTTVNFTAPTGTNTITFGDGSGLVCLNNSNCNGVNGGYLLFGSSSVQNGSTATSLIQANQQGSGALLDLQTSGAARFSIGNDGLTTISSGVRISNTTSAVAGTIRWTGTDYEGYNGSSWLSLTAGSGVTNPFVNVTKTADETQNNVVNPTATLQNDDHLSFAIGANETWNYRFTILANANVTPDIKFTVTSPAGTSSCRFGVQDVETAVSVSNINCGTSSGLITGNTTDDVYEIVGSVENGPNAGTIRLQWAQNTANALNTIVRRNSYLEAQRSVGGGVAQAFIQSGNALGTTAVLGTTDNNALSIITNGTEKIRVDASGNVGIGDGTPAALFTVGTADAFQVDASGNIITSGTLSVTGTTTLTGNLLANGSATGTTGTSSGTGTNTTTLTLGADSFSLNDVILIDNVGQDYYTRVTVDPGTGSYTVSPAVTFENARTVTKYNVQNIGASSTDYITRNNRFFQGYFLGGVTVGAGSTTLADGVLSRTTGDIEITPGSGGIVNVNGTINATTITGDGSSITNIDGSAVSGATITGINAGNISTGTLADVRLSSNVVLLNSSPSFTGSVTATGFSGDGSGLTTINGSNISSGTVADARLSANVGLLTGAQTYSALKTFGAGATITTGQTLTINGDGFTDLTGSGLANNSGVLETTLGIDIDLASVEVTGVLADSNLSTNIAQLNLAQSFSALKTFGAGATITTGQTLTINGDGFTDLTGSGLTLSGSSLAVAYGSSANTAVQGNTGITITAGTGLSGGGSITLGSGGTVTLDVAYGSAANTAVQGNTAITCPSGTGNLTGGGGSITLGSGGSCGAISTNNAVSFTTSVTTPSLTSSGALAISSSGANTITIDTGGAAGITIAGTNSTSLALGNTSAQTTINGSTIVLGTSTIRRTASGTTNFELNDTANTTVSFTNTDVTAVANITIEGSVTAASLAGSGTGLTALSATNVGSGTLADGRLSSNIATLSGTQSFSGLKTFGAGAAVTTGQSITVNGDAFTDLTGTGLTISTGSLAIDTTYFNANYIQLGSAVIQTDATANSTIGINKTNATGNLITLQRSGVAAFTVGNSGALQIRATSTTGLDIQNGSGISAFSVDTSGSIVRIGQSTADATGVLLVLDTKNTNGDPTGENGAQYFNSARGTFRCFENGRGWTDCLGIAKPNTRRSTQFLANGTTTTLTSDGGDVAIVSGIGTAIAATTAIPASVNYATANGNNNDAGIVGNTNYNTSFNPSMQANVRLVTTASTRNWVGFTDQTLATMNGAANPAGIYAAFRYDTSAADTNWQCITKNGGAQTVINSTIVASTANIEMEIIIVNGTRVEFKINGVIVCTSLTNLPSAATMMRYDVSRRNLVAGAQSTQVSWIYIDSDQ